jgi:hypothetical protein
VKGTRFIRLDIKASLQPPPALAHRPSVTSIEYWAVVDRESTSAIELCPDAAAAVAPWRPSANLWVSRLSGTGAYTENADVAFFKEPWMYTSHPLDAAPALLFEHIRHQQIAAGRLMAPSAVQGALAGRKDAAQVPPGWYLCGSAHPEMYARLQAGANDIRHSVVLFPAPSGTHFLVINQRVDAWQHRFVLPLVGQTVRAFALSLLEQPVRLSLAAEGREATLLTAFNLSSEAVVACRAAVRDCDEPIGAMFSDFAAAAVSLLTPEAVVAGPQCELEDAQVCVSLVAHPAVEEALEERRPASEPVSVH